MRRLMFFLMFLICIPAFAQEDRSEVRAGNRKFKKDKFKEAEIEYRRAVVKDSTSLVAQYNLASSLYRQGNYDAASAALDVVKQGDNPAQYHFNAGDVALQKKDYAAAVRCFRESLLRDPGDLEAKESYIYAKKMLENQQNQQDQQDQDQQNQNQDQQEQPQPQPQPDNQDQQQNQSQQPQISKQQAQQMLNAIQAREKETQDKVNKEKAELLKSRQKEKNW